LAGLWRAAIEIPIPNSYLHDLQNHPRANILVGDRQMAVRSEVLGLVERAVLWPQLIAIAPTHEPYAQRAEREIPPVWLRPESAAHDSQPKRP
jgi:hypothetical protein